MTNMIKTTAKQNMWTIQFFSRLVNKLTENVWTDLDKIFSVDSLQKMKISLILILRVIWIIFQILDQEHYGFSMYYWLSDAVGI